MAAKLRRQQNKVDLLRRQNGGTKAALQGWRKRVRIAAARGNAPALHALRKKLLESSKRLGVRPAKLAAVAEQESE